MENSYDETFDRGIKLIDASGVNNAKKQRPQPSKLRPHERLSEWFIVPTSLEWTLAAAKLVGKCLHVEQAL